MLTNIGAELSAVLDSLAEKLGVAAERLYPVLMRQAYLDGVKAAAVAVFLFALTVICLICIYAAVSREYMKSFIQHTPRNFDDYADAVGPFVFALVLLTPLLFFFSGHAVNALLNSEWYALNTILKVLRK